MSLSTARIVLGPLTLAQYLDFLPNGSAFQALTIYGSQYALVVMGLLLVATVLVAPEGLIVTSAKLAGRLGRGSKESA